MLLKAGDRLDWALIRYTGPSCDYCHLQTKRTPQLLSGAGFHKTKPMARGHHYDQGCSIWKLNQTIWGQYWAITVSNICNANTKPTLEDCAGREGLDKKTNTNTNTKPTLEDCAGREEIGRCPPM